MIRAAGWLVVAAALIIAAGALPSGALFALAVGVIVTVAGAGATVLLAGRRLTVRRAVLEHEVREDQPIRLRFDVGLPGWLPARLEVRTGRHTWVPLAEGGGVVELPLGRRGTFLLDASRLRLSDALGIFRRGLAAGEPEPVLVLPVPATGTGVALPPGTFADEDEPDGLRPYRPGTPVSRIHWASLAHGRGLHERRMAAPPTGLPLVIVDTSGTTDPRALDWVARAAAGCVLRLSRRGGCEVLLPGDRSPTAVADSGAWQAVHRRLARLDGAQAGGVQRHGTAVVRYPDGLPLGPFPPPLPPGVREAPVDAVVRGGTR